MKPLFIPLTRKFYNAFIGGSKVEEYRLYGSRWNEQTCPAGRPVILSLGYGKQHRTAAVITSFRTDDWYIQRSADWIACYGKNPNKAACIGIRIIK